MIEKKHPERIILVGDGWGAVAAYKSLARTSVPVFVITNDSELRALCDSVLSVPLDTLCCEMLVFAGYKKIIPANVLDKNTCINIHYSLLPAYRGFHSTVWAILNDEPELGLSVHLMNEFIDDGPVIAQFRVANDFNKTSTQYMLMFNEYIQNHLGRIISDYVNGDRIPVPQDKTKASWVCKRNLEDCRIDFTQTLQYQKAFFRALVPPYPIPFFELKGEKIFVTDVEFYQNPVITHVGRIMNIDNEGMWMKVKDGYLIVKEMIDGYQQPIPTSRFTIGQYVNQ